MVATVPSKIVDFMDELDANIGDKIPRTIITGICRGVWFGVIYVLIMG
jgi:hypothetical protein